MEVSIIASKERDLYLNEQIRAKEVMVIGPNGEQLGVKPIKDALTLSSYAGFDLVLINPMVIHQFVKLWITINLNMKIKSAKKKT